MLEGFYTAASGMLVQQRTLNVLANNISNVRTPGYRVERVISSTFEQELITRIEKTGNSAHIGTGAPIRVVEESASIFDPSLLQETGRPFDLAIVGDGYFNVQNTGGETFLTRNGSFDMDAEGFLVLRGAGRVMGRKGEVEVGTAGFTVEADGTVYSEKGRKLDVLVISQPDAETKLEKSANGLYRAPEGVDLPEAQGSRVTQGLLEASNIDLNREYTLAMEAQRTFQSCSNALRIIDQLNQKTATQIASVG